MCSNIPHWEIQVTWQRAQWQCRCSGLSKDVWLHHNPLGNDTTEGRLTLANRSGVPGSPNKPPTKSPSRGTKTLLYIVSYLHHWWCKHSLHASSVTSHSEGCRQRICHGIRGIPDLAIGKHKILKLCKPNNTLPAWHSPPGHRSVPTTVQGLLPNTGVIDIVQKDNTKHKIQ